MLFFLTTLSGDLCAYEIKRRHFSTGLAALGASAWLGGCSRVPDSIKIGVGQPLSGPLALLGAGFAQWCAPLAVDELNKAGFSVGGKRVALEVLAQDDGPMRHAGAPPRSSWWRPAQGGDRHLNSGVSIETAPIYAAKNVPQLIISTNPKITQLGLPTTFRIVANDNLQARAP